MDPITQYRDKRKLTQEALAALVGTTKATISRIESGKRKPSVPLARRIAKTTGISMKALRPDVYGASA